MDIALDRVQGWEQSRELGLSLSHPLSHTPSCRMSPAPPTFPGQMPSDREAGRQRGDINDLDFPGGTDIIKQTPPWKRMKLKQTRVYFLPNYMQGREES